MKGTKIKLVLFVVFFFVVIAPLRAMAGKSCEEADTIQEMKGYTGGYHSYLDNDRLKEDWSKFYVKEKGRLFFEVYCHEQKKFKLTIFENDCLSRKAIFNSDISIARSTYTKEILVSPGWYYVLAENNCQVSEKYNFLIEPYFVPGDMPAVFLHRYMGVPHFFQCRGIPISGYFSNPRKDASFSLFYETDSEKMFGYDREIWRSEKEQQGKFSYFWKTENIEDGDYQIGAKVIDSKNDNHSYFPGGVFLYSCSKIHFDCQQGQLTVTQGQNFDVKYYYGNTEKNYWVEIGYDEDNIFGNGNERAGKTDFTRLFGLGLKTMKTSSLPSGSYYIYGVVKEKSGAKTNIVNINYSLCQVNVVPNRCSEIKVLTPAKNISVIQGGKVTIIGRAAGNGDNAIMELLVSRKDPYYRQSVNSLDKNLVNNFSYRWNTSYVYPGEYSIYCKSIDSNCKYFDVAQGKVLVKPAKTCPTVRIISPLKDIIVKRGERVRIVWEGANSKLKAPITLRLVRLVDDKPHYEIIKKGLPEKFTYNLDTSHLHLETYRIHCAIHGEKNSNFCYSPGTITIVSPD